MARIDPEGLTILGGRENAVIDVVFVHGLQGHPEHTWTCKRAAAPGPDTHTSTSSSSSNRKPRSKLPVSRLIRRKASPSSSTTINPEDAPPDQERGEKSVFWPRDLLQDDFPNVRVMTFGYDSKITRGYAPVNQGNILSHARNLLYAIEAKRRKEPERPLVFIAHSLGGILVKEVLRRSETDPDPKIKQIFESFTGVFFFGTPHRGSKEWADFGETLTKAAILILGVDANSQVVHALLPTSAELEICKDSFFAQWMQRRDKVTVRTFQESSGIVGVRWGSLNRMIVPPDSSTLDHPDQRTRMIEGDHMSMVRFRNKDDLRYEMIREDLRELISMTLKPGSSRRSSIQSSGQVSESTVHSLDVLQSEESFSIWCRGQGMSLAQSASIPGTSEGMADEMLEWMLRDIDFNVWLTEESSNTLLISDFPGGRMLDVCSFMCDKLSSPTDHTLSCAVLRINFSRSRRPASLDTLIRLHRDDWTSTTMTMTESEYGIEYTNLDVWNKLETLCLFLRSCNRIYWVFDHAFRSIEIEPFVDQLVPAVSRASQSNVVKAFFITTGQLMQYDLVHSECVTIRRGTELRQCLETLHFLEWNARERMIANVVSGGSWLDKNEKYNAWIQSTKSDLLWIAGKPGSGKSTLTKIIVRQLQKDLGIPLSEAFDDECVLPSSEADAVSNDMIVAVFHYSFRGGYTEASHEFMLRSLLYQILKSNGRVFPYLQQRLRSILRSAQEWGYDDLKVALASLHKVHFKMTVVLVVDGMDESDNERRTDVLDFLTDFASKSSLCTVKLLIASRPESYVRPWMGRSSHIFLESENRVDIQVVVKDGISKIERLRDPTFDAGLQSSNETNEVSDFGEIGSYIVENSAGVFLWVNLVLKELEDCVIEGGYSLSDLDDLVRRLPRDLRGKDGFYGLMIKRLSKRHASNETHRGRARRIFTFITFADRALSVPELGDALAVPIQAMQPEALRRFDMSRHRPRDIETGLYSLTGGLVEIRKAHTDEQDNFVQLIHQTTREFLLARDKIAWPYDMDETSGDIEIVRTCCYYLRIIFLNDTLLQGNSNRADYKSIARYLSSFPLLKYVLLSFGDHLKRLIAPKHDNKGVWEDLEFTLNDINEEPTSYSALLLSKWIALIDEGRTVNLSQESEICLSGVITAAASNNMAEAVRQCCILRAGRRDALKGAASAGHLKIVEILLEYETSTSRQGVDKDRIKEESSSTSRQGVDNDRRKEERQDAQVDAMEAAAAHGHAAIVRLLMDKKDNRSNAKFWGSDALHAAASAGHTETAQLLFRYGMDRLSENEKHETPLDLARNAGHMEIVQMLNDDAWPTTQEAMYPPPEYRTKAHSLRWPASSVPDDLPRVH